MPVIPGDPITQADLDALAQLANDKLLPIVNQAIASNENGWGDAGWSFYGGVIVGGSYFNIYNVPASTADGFQTIEIPQPEYKFDITKKNWADELNRIRGDVMALVFTSFTDAGALFYSPNCILSGPWVVGVNDPDTFPMDGGSILPSQGELFGTYGASFSDAPPPPNFTIFKSVSFCYAEDDASGGITVSTGRRGDAWENTGSGRTVGWNLTATASLAGDWVCTLTWKFNWQGGGTPPASPPPASDFALTVTPSTGVTWETSNDTSAGNYILTGTISKSVTPGDIAILFDPITTPAGYAFSGDVFNRCFVSIRSEIFYATASSPEIIQGVHPTSAIKSVAASDQPADSDFILEGSYSAAIWKISDPTVKGVWVAKTLPVPGQNVFCDQDMPPFVGGLADSGRYDGPVVVSLSSVYGYNAPWTSSMREFAPALFDDTQMKFVSAIKDFGLLQSSMAARPTPYLVLRDTDFVPFSYGYNVGTSSVHGSYWASADGSLNYYGIGVPGNAAAVKIRVVKYGTGRVGWKNGVFQYGDALDTPLNIYVRQSGFPTTSDYDFKKTDSTVTIGPDGGSGYLTGIILAGGFNYAIENTSGQDVLYDRILEIDTVAAPVKQFFPAYDECFSYSINGMPRIQGFADTYLRNKPIPQNGYCIFKLRATRLPLVNAAGISITPSSGAEIVVTIGQNKLQPDNTLVFTPMLQDDGITPFTVTIPAIGRDSGDVAVFWPVLGGNEIVYQCTEQVIIEAWVNWQPIFFNAVFAGGPDPNSIGGGLQVEPDAMAFQYALGFINHFNKVLANYSNDRQPITVQFPISVDIYNDLWELLGGMSYPSPAGGAGGSGGAGGGGGAGGAGGGGGF